MGGIVRVDQELMTIFTFEAIREWLDDTTCSAEGEKVYRADNERAIVVL